MQKLFENIMNELIKPRVKYTYFQIMQISGEKFLKV